jgi:hypothetical protein
MNQLANSGGRPKHFALPRPRVAVAPALPPATAEEARNDRSAFTDAAGELPSRVGGVVVAEEPRLAVHRVGGQKQTVSKHSSWCWLVTEELAGYDALLIWRIGYQRWGARAMPSTN